MSKISIKIALFTAAISIAAFEILPKVDFNFSNEKYLNPLIINNGLIQSIRKNNLNNIDKYLSYSKLKINTQTHKGSTPLIEAIMNDRLPLEYFKKILSLSDVNLLSTYGYAPIHIAIQSKNFKKVMLISSVKGFNETVSFEGHNIVEFANAAKNNCKNLNERLELNKIITYLSNKFPNQLKQNKNR